MGIKLTGLIPAFQISDDFIVISKKENKKSKLIFFRFSLYNPLYRFKIPEQPKNGGVGL